MAANRKLGKLPLGGNRSVLLKDLNCTILIHPKEQKQHHIGQSVLLAENQESCCQKEFPSSFPCISAISTFQILQLLQCLL